MNTTTPAPLLVQPSTGVLLHSLIQANPAVPTSYEPPDLPEVFGQTLRVCQELQRPITVAELAARMGHSPAVVGVIITELIALDLVHVVHAPAWATRLRTWATHNRPVPVASSVIKMLTIGTQTEHTQHALRSVAETGPWILQETPRIDIATTHLAQDLHMLTLGLNTLGSTSPVWGDVCREAFGAVLITGPETHELHAAHESLMVLHQAQVPVVVLVHHHDQDQVDTDVVRAVLGLPEETLVVGDVHGRGVCDAVMDLCSTLVKEGRS